MNSNDGGFTLIELMIVVAIIGILAAIAIPEYMNYTARTQVSEASSLVDGVKTAVESYITANGSFPTDLSGLGARTSGKYVATLAAASTDTSGAGTITVTFRSAGVASGIHGKTVLWKRDDNGVWSCSPGTIDKKYLPYHCR